MNMQRNWFCFTALALCLFSASTGKAEVIFFDGFNYPVGVNLAGRNGGQGFAGAYQGGTSLIAGPLPGTMGNTVAVGTQGSLRTISTPQDTQFSSLYLSFISRVNSGFSGNAGITLLNSGSQKILLGVPTSPGSYLGITSEPSGSSPSTSTWSSTQFDTNYLTLFEFVWNNNLTTVNMYVSTDLTTSGASLLSNPAKATLSRAAFTFDQIQIQGSTTGFSLAGMALANNVNEAVGATLSPVPEPGTLLLGGIAAACGGGGVWWKRRRRPVEKQPPAETPAN